jgi:3-dehydroquinate synthase
MHRTLFLLLLLTLAAVAVPAVPWAIWGTRLDRAVADWLDPLPPAPVLAGLEIGVLAADILLPVPSSLVATLGGAALGVVPGTACAWLGMTAGALAGWALGRVAGGTLAAIDPADRLRLDRERRRLGPFLVVLSRPLPLVAEAVALLAGGTRMPAGGNVAVAAAWSIAGSVGGRGETLPAVLAAALVIPVAGAWLVARRRWHPEPPAG